MPSHATKAAPTVNQLYSNRTELDPFQLIIVIINVLCTSVNQLNKRFISFFPSFDLMPTTQLLRYSQYNYRLCAHEIGLVELLLYTHDQFIDFSLYTVLRSLLLYSSIQLRSYL